MKQGIFMRKMEDGATEIIIDVIGIIGWEVWYPAMRDMLKTIPDTVEQVIFDIYSPGGNVFEGNAISNEIAALKQKTLARVQVAASMATVIAVSCDEREIAKNGRWLIHNPWAALMGDADAMEQRSKELRNYEREFAELYAERTGQTFEDMAALMNEERWLTPKETQELGFVSKINDPFDQAAFADVKAEIVAAGKWPKALVEMPEDNQEELEDENANSTGTESGKTPPVNQPNKPADGDSAEGVVKMQRYTRRAIRRATRRALKMEMHEQRYELMQSERSNSRD